ncbi:MAG: CBS domain-containing protein [Desulfatibacillaceae bacterium]
MQDREATSNRAGKAENAPRVRAGTDAGVGITVITTHINADFDAFASLLAAQKLYPDALVVFPGSQESSLRNFFIESMVYLFNIVNINEVDLDAVTRLVIVDTRQPSRIGRMAEVLDKPGLEIHVYDHHPDSDGDIQGDVERIRPTGASITILLDELREKGVTVTADEATVMMLGIYEDTGSFSFASTTPDEFEAAGYLLTRGANLNMVSSLISREMSPMQVGILNDLIQSMVVHRIHGIEVAVATLTTDEYINDFAFLVHKLMRMENMDALFALARMGNRVHMIGRSRIAEVDVGRVATAFGGGGHPAAAAATIREEALPQVKEKVVSLLHKYVKPRRRARDIMSTPAIRTPPATTIRKAGGLLTQYNINALLVTQELDGCEQLLGIINRQVIEKALHHHLDDVEVREYMSSEPVAVGPEASLSEIQDKIINHKQRLLPVVDDCEILGVITRTDLLNILVSKSSRMPEPLEGSGERPSRGHTRKVTKVMSDRLPDHIMDMLRLLGDKAGEMEVDAYVVGGFVRDLMLMRSNEDLDVVIEGDGVAYAKRLAKEVGGRAHCHDKFRTAVVVFPDGYKVDVATARFEYYHAPASLPVVETSSLKLDLYRRDFTINTLVIQLNGENFGTLIDFFGAQRDLKARTIQVLHNLSFVEDPTRVYRAIRFEQRFGFTIGKLTCGLIENAVRMEFFERLAGRRLFTELKLILQEEDPLPAIKRMNEFNLLRTIHPELAYDARMEELFSSAKEAVAWFDLLFLDESYMKWAVYFQVLVHALENGQVREVCQRLELADRHCELFCDMRKGVRDTLRKLERKAQMANSTLYRLLEHVPTEHLVYMMAATREEAAKRRISRFYTQLRDARPLVSGKDLIGMGLSPGPRFKDILDAVHEARLDGRLRTYEDELAYVREMVG